MTREEQRYLKAATKAVESSIKNTYKKYDMKRIVGFIYQNKNDFLYELLISVPPIQKGQQINVLLWCKPIDLDDIFWDVFDMTEEVKGQPFSFHVRGAFTAQCYELEKWSVPLQSIEDTDLVVDELLLNAKKKIEQYAKKLKSVSDFAKIIQDDQYQKLNKVLCSIYEEKYDQALKQIDVMLQKHNSGGFSSSKGDIVDYARRYCIEKINK